jgi:hypothetical protein
MGSQIQISSPFLRSFSTDDNTVGTSISQILTPTTAGEKRIVVIVQNTSTTHNVQLMGNATDTNGIYIYPLSTVSLDNYNGGLWAKAGAAGVSVHVSIASV